ncbi:protein of unknown function (plasmid) [Azospirillum baldaniorum]|uniref:Uncharacterized protein n=1 Tax=Azospirillum baldaniorum TaxID=1064539 RepID=A0A9P1K060_9PROT|nr:protein of unknown function [Azospirillum baldaniorum]
MRLSRAALATVHIGACPAAQ